jgi:hypothetical protein
MDGEAREVGGPLELRDVVVRRLEEARGLLDRERAEAELLAQPPGRRDLVLVVPERQEVPPGLAAGRDERDRICDRLVEADAATIHVVRLLEPVDAEHNPSGLAKGLGEARPPLRAARAAVREDRDAASLARSSDVRHDLEQVVRDARVPVRAAEVHASDMCEERLREESSDIVHA